MCFVKCVVWLREGDETFKNTTAAISVQMFRYISGGQPADPGEASGSQIVVSVCIYDTDNDDVDDDDDDDDVD